VAGVGYASSLTFSIDGTTCTTTDGATTVGLDHSFVSDLVGTLASPGGKTARLFAHADGSGNNLCQVVFDDTAARPLSEALTREAPFTGTWRPDDALDPLLAGAVDGDWTFTVVDNAPADTGAIRAVSLHIKGFDAG
jgi:subtilisin-like proprotein convertase family protein